jgi:serine protease AprX
MTAAISFKTGSGLFEQAFEMRQETAVAVLVAYQDVSGLAPPDLDRVTRAVSLHVLDGRGDRFDPDVALSRADLARSLALTAGVPQRVPSRNTFPDVGSKDAAFPFVETVAGARAARILMESPAGRPFRPKDAVSRLDFTQAVVRAAGLQEEAQARAGEALGLADESAIPAGLRGYVAVALERGLIDSVARPEGPCFDPAGSLRRIDAAGFLLALLDLRA